MRLIQKGWWCERLDWLVTLPNDLGPTGRMEDGRCFFCKGVDTACRWVTVVDLHEESVEEEGEGG